MKIMTVVGTRPEIIRLSAVLQRLDATPDHGRRYPKHPRRCGKTTSPHGGCKGFEAFEIDHSIP